MIAIATEQGGFLRAIPASSDRVFGFHRLFGFVSEDAAHQRLRNRKAHGLKNVRAGWLFRFRLKSDQGRWAVESLDGCSAQPLPDGSFRLVSDQGTYLLASHAELQADHLGDTPDSDGPVSRVMLFLAIAFFLFATAMWLFGPDGTQELPPPIPEPVSVHVVPPTNAVRIPPPTITTPHAELAKKPTDDGGKRAVARDLGFLGLLGKKELKQAVGGIPSGLQNVTPGAGEQGVDKGTGGEMLVGLGQGVKRTTVGNTGVAGLGGVGGGKGPGGGAGGYGDTLVGSGTGAGVGDGSGRSLTSLPLSRDIELEGGLDKAVIQATIAKYLSQVRACYEQGLRNNPALAGQVTMNFEIGPAGKLNYSKVGKSSLGDAKVPECIAERMMTWDFPKPIGGVSVKVNYPFLLRPVNG